MSAIGASLSSALGSLGGPGTVAVLMAGGIAVGALGGGLAAGAGRSQQGSAAGELAVYPCPDTGPALVMIQAGQRVLVTARTEDSAWLRIHVPLPGRSEGWVETSPLTVDGAVASLPVAECAPELAAGVPSFQPVESLTAVADNPPSAPPTPVPTATPEPTPPPTSNAKPKLTALTASTKKVSYDTASYCPTAVKKVTFRVKASDTSGVDGVTLFWRAPGAARYVQAAMSRTAGSARSGTWQVSLNTTANGITKAGKLAFYAVATDTAGATRKFPAGGASSITVAVCVNTGPTIRSASSSSGSSLAWDPLGVARCQTATNITAAVKDKDGVKSVTLFYRRPGSSTWSSKPMNSQTVAGKWYANLDTLGDKITIPKPPTGALSWYIKAVDDKNVASRTKTASITIRRCDSEAGFDGVFPSGEVYSCAKATITIATYANDPDQPSDGLKVVFSWRLTNPRVPATKAVSGKVTANVKKGNYYQGTTASFTGQNFYAGLLTVYAVTTDRYRGTTQSRTYTQNMFCR